MKRKNIILIGAPGSGKGTLAKMLSEKLDFAVVSMGDTLRKESKRETTLGELLRPLLGTGGLVPDDMATMALENEVKNIDPNKGILFDGYPRSIPQVMSLDGILESIDKDIDYVIHLNVSDDIVMKRIKSRAAIENRKDDQDESTVLIRLEAFRNTTEPVIAHYRKIKILKTIDGSGTPEQVFEEVMTILTNIYRPTEDLKKV